MILLIDDNNYVIASSEADLDELRAIGTALSKVNGEHYSIAAVTETISPPKSALAQMHPWLLNNGHTASVQEILQRIKDAFAEISVLPVNQLPNIIGPLCGVLRAIESKFDTAEIDAALLAIDGFNLPAYRQLQSHLFQQHENMVQILPDYNGDLDACIAAWFITRDDRELLFVINQANLATSVRMSAARWALNSLASGDTEIRATLERLGYMPLIPHSQI